MKKHSITIFGHATSITLEDAFWQELKTIAHDKDTSLAHLIEDIDSKRDPGQNLSSALRVYVLRHFRALLERK